MKCKPLRRRYVAFRTDGDLCESDLVYSLTKLSPPATKIRVISRSGPFAIVRVDQRALRSLLSACGKPMNLACGSSKITSIMATGSVKKAKEKIKNLQSN